MDWSGAAEWQADNTMRRLFALMLIATSGWLLYQTSNDYLGGMDHLLSDKLAGYVDEPDFMFPAVGSVLGLLGGLTVFFGGPGGATLALLGGIGIAGFGIYLNQPAELAHFWDNQLAVGVVIAMLSTVTASISRDRRKMSLGDDDHTTYSSGRRTF